MRRALLPLIAALLLACTTEPQEPTDAGVTDDLVTVPCPYDGACPDGCQWAQVGAACSGDTLTQWFATFDCPDTDMDGSTYTKWTECPGGCLEDGGNAYCL